MNFPTFDGRTPLSKEVMNDLVEAAAASQHLTGIAPIDVSQRRGSMGVIVSAEAYSQVEVSSGIIVRDLLFQVVTQWPKPAGYLPWSSDTHYGSNTRLLDAPGNTLLVGESSLSEGFPAYERALVSLGSYRVSPYELRYAAYRYGGHKYARKMGDNVLLFVPSRGVSGGTFRLRYQGVWSAPLAWDGTITGAGPDSMQTLLEPLFGDGNFWCMPAYFEPTDPTWFPEWEIPQQDRREMQPFAIRLSNKMLGMESDIIVDTDASSLSGTEPITLTASVVRGMTSPPPQARIRIEAVESNAVNYQQFLCGTFRIGLTSDGPWSSDISPWASPEEVQTALDEIPELAGEITVHGSMVPCVREPWIFSNRDILLRGGNSLQGAGYWLSTSPDFGLQDPTQANNFPWPAITTRLDRIVVSAGSWTVSSVSTLLPWPFSYTNSVAVSAYQNYEMALVRQAYDLIPHTDRLWSNPQNVLVYPRTCYFAEFTSPGDMQSFTVSNGSRSIVIPGVPKWAQHRFLAAAFVVMSQNNRGETIAYGSIVPATLPVNNLTLDRPAYDAIVRQTIALSYPWTLVCSEKATRIIARAGGNLVIDNAGVRFWDEEAGEGPPTGRAVFAARNQSNEFSVDPFSTKISFDPHRVELPFPEGIATSDVANGLLPPIPQALLLFSDYRHAPEPNTSVYQSVATARLDGDGILFAEGQGFLWSTLSSVDQTYVPSGGGIEFAEPPRGFILGDSVSGSSATGPDVRMLKRIGYVPWRVIKRIGSSSTPPPLPDRFRSYIVQYYNTIIHPDSLRSSDRVVAGPMGEQAYAFLDDISPPNGGTKWAGTLMRDLYRPASVDWPFSYRDQFQHPSAQPLRGDFVNPPLAIGTRLRPATWERVFAGEVQEQPFSDLLTEYFIGTDLPSVPEADGPSCSISPFNDLDHYQESNLRWRPGRIAAYHNMEDIPIVPPRPRPGDVDYDPNALQYGMLAYGCQFGPIYNAFQVGGQPPRPRLDLHDPFDEGMTRLYCGPEKFMTIDGPSSGRFQAVVSNVSGTTDTIEGTYTLLPPSVMNYDDRTCYEAIVPIPGGSMVLYLSPSRSDHFYNDQPVWYLLVYFLENGQALQIDPRLDYEERYGFPVAISLPCPAGPTKEFVLAINGKLRYAVANYTGPTTVIEERDFWQGETPLPLGVIRVTITELPPAGNLNWLSRGCGCDTSRTMISANLPGLLAPTSGYPTAQQPSPETGTTALRSVWPGLFCHQSMADVGCLPVKLRVSVIEEAITGYVPIGKTCDDFHQPTPNTRDYSGLPPLSDPWWIRTGGNPNTDPDYNNGEFTNLTGSGSFVLWGYAGAAAITVIDLSTEINAEDVNGWLTPLSYSFGSGSPNYIGTNQYYPQSFVLAITRDRTILVRYVLWQWRSDFPVTQPVWYSGVLNVASTDPFQGEGFVDVFTDPTRGPTPGRASRLRIIVTM